MKKHQEEKGKRPKKPLLSKRMQNKMNKRISNKIRLMSNICGGTQKAIEFSVEPEEQINIEDLVHKITSSHELVLVKWNSQLRTIMVCNSKPRIEFNCEDLFL
ncbi:hypothetical protein GYA37_01595 [candidate division WWE3 bacterium]|uniref:Uncharacterized protein n=1 Tax=candidate division WWE3 bacterium TaxID=2053526 RepID=A0A7X9E6P2_UNCKA|nr:hypothetical protein [candidate division WWE3 bacterium]